MLRAKSEEKRGGESRRHFFAGSLQAPSRALTSRFSKPESTRFLSSSQPMPPAPTTSTLAARSLATVAAPCKPKRGGRKKGRGRRGEAVRASEQRQAAAWRGCVELHVRPHKCGFQVRCVKHFKRLPFRVERGCAAVLYVSSPLSLACSRPARCKPTAASLSMSA